MLKSLHKVCLVYIYYSEILLKNLNFNEYKRRFTKQKKILGN